MEPRRGGVPPGCSLAPPADALSLALYLLLLLGVPGCALAQPLCKEEEYPVGNECCPKCSPGYHVVRACGELSGTVCAPCPGETYTAHHNGLSKCLPCRECHAALGLVTRRACSHIANAVCGCDHGHFCVSKDADHCDACRPHSTCRPGQRVQETGTESRDTVCGDCPPGTFSPNGSLEQCQPWTRCSHWLLAEAVPGTNRTDATCSPWRQHLVWGFAIIIILLLVLAVFIWKWQRRKRPPGDQVTDSIQGKRSEASKPMVLEALPSVTTVAEEETAPVLA
ncbi:tumor necrosis factor receptor superfamily member 14 isoform X1 [Ochotona princeps]|uniref:tumor necrosis factor receptor superfamily member 14 isoform X1 n=1 Tax=Ochotona princeps TaxID=9978 RepID=UPI002714FEFF|nr:tumor necrosis factor receptor superfamily member 14 isoform X1 [Ochotona princeps]